MSALSDVILFVDTDRNIMTMTDHVGPTPVVILPPGPQEWISASASPDGQTIVAATSFPSTWWRMNADGSGLHQFVNVPSGFGSSGGASSGVTFSPDGSRFVGYYGDNDGVPLGFSLVNLDDTGSIEVPVLHGSVTPDAPLVSAFFTFSVYWSPDGTRLAFTGYDFPDNGRTAVCVCNIDGSGLTVLLQAPALPLVGSINYTVYGWLDNNHVLAEGWTGGSVVVNVDATDSSTTVLYNDPDGVHFFADMDAISPDGTEIALVDNTTSGLAIFDIATTERVDLVTPPILGMEFLQWVRPQLAIPPRPPPALAIGNATSGHIRAAL